MTKYLFMKLVGLLLVIVGFSYSMTSFYGFYDYIYGNYVIANANIYIMSMGLFFPLYTFIFGIYFYFYVDKHLEEINPLIFLSSIFFIMVGIIRLFMSNSIMQFIHYSYYIPMIVLGIMLLAGCLKYKY